jgi:hypothetical protein
MPLDLKIKVISVQEIWSGFANLVGPAMMASGLHPHQSPLE